MRQAREEMLQSLNENNLEKMRKAAKGAKQTLKMKDGSIGMDSFTASAIMQIYDKVNDKNKKTMENLLKDGKKADIVKLMKFAMSKVNSEYVPEEFEEKFELDEGKMSAAQIAKLKKAYEPMRGKKISMTSGQKLSSIMDKVDDDKQALIQLVKADIPFVSQLAVTRLITKHGMKGAEIRKMQEEVELDEASYALYHKDFSSAMQHSYKMAKKMYGITIDPKEIDDKVASGPRKPSEGKTNKYRLKGDKGAIQVQVYNKGGSKPFELNMYKEEVELGEGRMKELHGYIEQGMSAKEIAKKMKLDVKTIQALMPKKEEVEEGAAADARRAMRGDPDMRQRAFSKDDSATDDDRKAASKNIMMQMRKAQSLKGRFDVEFQDGKKMKVPTKIAMAVQQKYNSFRKPADKEKFQAQVGKSYKDMLAALKEGFASDAQRRAAFASGYKEKGKKKKESTLERMNRKIQEKKNG